MNRHGAALIAFALIVGASVSSVHAVAMQAAHVDN
jgi:hypothetical protein